MIREMQALRKDGNEFDCELVISEVRLPAPATRLFTVTIRDITERKRAEKAEAQAARIEQLREREQEQERIQELEVALAHQRSLTGWEQGSVTAQMAGVGALREREPEVFSACQTDYESLLDLYLEALGFKSEPPRREINDLAARIGEQGGGPRDVIELHIKAVTAKSADVHPKRAKAYTLEGRLLALEAMGYLVDYYRMGRAVAQKDQKEK